MKNLMQDIKNYFNNNMVLYRLVLINVMVFISVNFIDLFGFLFGLNFSLDKLLRLFFGLEAGVGILSGNLGQLLHICFCMLIFFTSCLICYS